MNKILALSNVLLLMLFISTASRCNFLGAGSGANEMSKLNSSIEELTGSAFEVPLRDDFPLLYSFVRKPPVEVDKALTL